MAPVEADDSILVEEFDTLIDYWTKSADASLLAALAIVTVVAPEVSGAIVDWADAAVTHINANAAAARIVTYLLYFI